ncbi:MULTISPECIES: DUF6705 family protein [unclassified Chryseobacterium]|uniref:DUF6705 family protein n=1 Tax=unclassified Chryseobacterium TaxID=2593645 RepID=UPI00226994DB|nr:MULTISPECIES: DUF6705 family protein [unclassified Chryseobacterium]
MKTFILSFFMTGIIYSNCKSQTIALNTPLLEIPPNAYKKDLNNELDSYTGIYTASFQSKEITLYITKIEHVLQKSSRKNYYSDILDIKYIIKNVNGSVLQDTKNDINSKIKFFSIQTRPTLNTIIFFYSGTNCNVGWGDIFLKKISPTQISWEYHPDDIILDESRCPQGADINIYLPETKDLIFTKQ